MHLDGRPPYGCRKKGSASKSIVPDGETAPVVKRIFSLCASGKGQPLIAKILTEQQPLTPVHFCHRKHGNPHAAMDMDHPYRWGVGPVASIPDNRVCLGQMTALRTTSLSCKNKELIHKPENEQVLVENSHGPLIAPEQWDIVQNVQAHRERFPKHMAEPALFPNRCSALPAANRWSCTGPVRRKNGSTTSSAIPTASEARQRAPRAASGNLS